MHQSYKTYITLQSKMLYLIEENHLLLLLLQHFNIDFAVENKTVKELCKENNIPHNIFIIVSNLYNGFFPDIEDVLKISNVKPILFYLENGHNFYIENKFPELRFYLTKLQQRYDNVDFKFIEKFFSDYFNEVMVHLRYEDEVAFPYFYNLSGKKGRIRSSNFSAQEYKNHHTDIETKVTDIKNLFLKHIKVRIDQNIKRKFLNSLFELEFDLKIHSIVEEKVLVPIIEKIEDA